MNMKRFTFISDRQPTAEDANPQSYVLDENYAFIKWFKVTPEQAWYPLPTSSQSQEQKVKNLLDAIDQVAAALETCVAQFGQQMTRADLESRRAAISAARAAQANAEGYASWEEAVSAWTEE